MTRTTRLMLLIVLASLALGACTPVVRESRPTTLAGTAWRVVSINGLPPVIGSDPTVAFTATEVEGSAGCNTYVNSPLDVSYGVKRVSTSFRAASQAIFVIARLPNGEIVLSVDAVPA